MTETKDIYSNGEYLDQNPDWHQSDSDWKAKQIIATLEGSGLFHLDTFCEVGCGAGGVIRRVAEQLPDAQCSGYEISPQAHDRCLAGSTPPNLQFHLADLLAEEIDPFDLVMAIDVIEHVENCVDFLRQLRAKAEYKLFHIPLELSAQATARSTPLVSSRNRLGHLHYFNRDLALETLHRAGYEVLNARYTCWATDMNRGFKSTLLKIPRKAMYALASHLTPRLFGGYSLMVLAR